MKIKIGSKEVEVPATWKQFVKLQNANVGYYGSSLDDFKQAPNRYNTFMFAFLTGGGLNRIHCKESCTYEAGRHPQIPPILVYANHPNFSALNIATLLRAFERKLGFRPSMFHQFSDTDKAMIIEPSRNWHGGTENDDDMLKANLFFNLVRFGVDYDRRFKSPATWISYAKKHSFTYDTDRGHFRSTKKWIRAVYNAGKLDIKGKTDCHRHMIVEYQRLRPTHKCDQDSWY